MVFIQYMKIITLMIAMVGIVTVMAVLISMATMMAIMLTGFFQCPAKYFAGILRLPVYIPICQSWRFATFGSGL